MKEISKLTLLLFPLLLMGCLGQIGAQSLDQLDPLPTAIEVAQLPNTPTAEPAPTQTPIPTATAIPQTEATPTDEPLETATAEPTPTEVVEEADPTPIPIPGSELINFEAGEQGWYVVDDDVMGGVSSSQAEYVDPGLLYFYGNMSLDNNGGFSSVRSDWKVTDLSAGDGVLLRVKGDGKVFRFRLRTQSAGRGISYNALFETKDNEWSLVYIPFADMVPTYRGFVMDVESVNAEQVGSFGFMLTDKQEGEFELLVDWIRLVNESELEPSY